MAIKVTSMPGSNRKIVTPYAKIILSDRSDKPYWNIHYLDPADGEIHIGFGSYCRKNVEEWLENEFEVYEVQNGKPTQDAEIRTALSTLAEAVVKKYPGAIKVHITMEAGCADLRIEQTDTYDYCRGR